MWASCCLFFLERLDDGQELWDNCLWKQFRDNPG